MKKIIYCILIFMIGISVLTSCNNNQKIKTKDGEIKLGDTGGLNLPIDNKNTKLTLVAVSAVNNPNEKYVFSKLREITGIDLQIEAYPASTFIEKIKVVIASKNLPDIIGDGVGSITEINDIATQGAFASINDYLEEMPNFKKIFYDNEEYSWVFKSFAATDGKLYGFPHFDTSRDVNHGMLYRKDIFDKHGIKMWNSTEEFYHVLQRLKEIYPDSVPFTSKNTDGIFSSLSTSWGVVSHKPYYDEEEKIWKYSDTDEKTKNMLNYLRKLYDNGLIDPEFLTLTQAAWTAKMTQADKAFTTFDWIGRMDLFKEQTKDTYPEYDLRYANPMGPKGTIITLSKVLSMFATVAKNKNSELSMKLMDFLYSPAGAELMTMGIQDETYTIDEKGKAKYIELPEGKKAEMTDLEEKYGMFMQGTYKRMDRRSSYFNFSQREQEAQDKAIKENRFEPEDPVLSFTKDETQILTEIQSKLTTAAKETFVNYILSDKTGEKAWQEWVKKANDLGATQLVEVYQNAQKRFEAQE